MQGQCIFRIITVKLKLSYNLNFLNLHENHIAKFDITTLILPKKKKMKQKISTLLYHTLFNPELSITHIHCTFELNSIATV